MLGFYAVQERRSEVVDFKDTGRPVVFFLEGWKVLRQKVPVAPEEEMPQAGEDHPRYEKTGEKYEESVAPA